MDLSLKNNLTIFFVAFSTLMLELTLTRIFSVMLFYNFAFMAISIALFGMSVAGLYIYLFPKFFSKQNANKQLCAFTFIFALSLLFFLFIIKPFSINLYAPLNTIPQLFFIYFFSSIPFFFSGLVISLLITHYVNEVSTLYFFDLIGAALGTLLLIPLLNFIGAFNIVLLLAVLNGILAFILSREGQKQRMASWISGGFVVCAVIILIINYNYSIIHLPYPDPLIDSRNFIFDKWNSFSRVSVYPTNDTNYVGMPTNYHGFIPPQMIVLLDSGATTNIIPYQGKNKKNIEFLKSTLASIPYELKNDSSKILIIGPGGGRDILTASSLGMRNITGVELNPIVVDDVMKGKFREYSGNLYNEPSVNILVGEGRNFIKRSDKKYDVIQATLVDTWAASASGAYSLSENLLYTKEAFEDYITHLSEDGILTMTRWIFVKQERETIRLLSLALAAFDELGIKDPETHIAIYRIDFIGLFVLKKTPFTEKELEMLGKRAEELGAEPLLVPNLKIKNEFSKLINSEDRNDFYENYYFDISPTTDDKPFFFYSLRPRNFLGLLHLEPGGRLKEMGLFSLISLLGIIIFLSGLFIVAPLFLRSKNVRLRDALPPILYFSFIGIGFIFLEIATMQKFGLFLGHPTYSLSVVLFGFLFFSGIGSYLSNYIRTKTIYPPLGVIGITLLQHSFFDNLFSFFFTSGLFVRAMVSFLWIAPLAIFLGMHFPLGMRRLNESGKGLLIPWAWGINGVMTVLGSVLSVFLAMNIGFSTVILLGASMYGLLFFFLLTKRF